MVSNKETGEFEVNCLKKDSDIMKANILNSQLQTICCHVSCFIPLLPLYSSFEITVILVMRFPSVVKRALIGPFL